jgi:hypothetical protein
MLARMTSAEPHDPDILDHAWSFLDQLLAAVFSLFLAPAALALVRVVDRPMQRDILAWLRGMEASARRLLLIDALALLPPAPQPLHSASPKPMTRAPRAYRSPLDNPFGPLSGRRAKWGDNPEEWAVTFRCAKPQRSARRRRRRPANDPVNARFVSSLGLAERLEALRRVIASPATFAARLARRLLRQPRLAERVRGPYVPVRTDPAGALFHAAEAALARRDSS